MSWGSVGRGRRYGTTRAGRVGLDYIPPGTPWNNGTAAHLSTPHRGDDEPIGSVSARVKQAEDLVVGGSVDGRRWLGEPMPWPGVQSESRFLSEVGGERVVLGHI